MSESERLMIEQMTHDALCGKLGPGEQRKLLRLLCKDHEAREIAEELISFQEQCWHLLGLPKDVDVPAGLPALDLNARPNRHSTLLASEIKRSMLVAAAFVIVGLAALLALQVVSNNSNKQQLAQYRAAEEEIIEQSDPDAMIHLRTVWRMAGGADRDTWVFVQNGDGQFGSLGDSAGIADQGAFSEGVVLMRCQVLDHNGRAVYAVDMLLPDLDHVRIEVPRAGIIEGNSTTLQIGLDQGIAQLGLRLNQAGLGVNGQLVIGGTTEIGQFRYEGQTLRAVVDARLLSEL